MKFSLDLEICIGYTLELIGNLGKHGLEAHVWTNNTKLGMKSLWSTPMGCKTSFCTLIQHEKSSMLSCLPIAQFVKFLSFSSKIFLFLCFSLSSLLFHFLLLSLRVRVIEKYRVPREIWAGMCRSRGFEVWCKDCESKQLGKSQVAIWASQVAFWA